MGRVLGRASSGARAGAGGGLALATVVALLALLPAGAQAATDAADSKLGSLSATAATATPDGRGVLVATHAAGTTTIPQSSRISLVDQVSNSVASSVLLHSGAPSVTMLEAAKQSDGRTAIVAIEPISTTSFGIEVATAAAGSLDLGPIATTSYSGTRAGKPIALVVSPTGSAYVELASGEIDTVNLADASVTALTTTAVTSPAGGLAISPDGNVLYAGNYAASASINLGTVAQIPVGSPTTVSYAAFGTAKASMRPTSLVATGSSVYVAGSAGLARLDVASSFPADRTDPTTWEPIWLYPISTMTCGDLSLAGSYLFCAPATTTDAHVYRFELPTAAGSGPTHAVGVPVSARPSQVWGRANGAVYLYQAPSIGYVEIDPLADRYAIDTFPQPVSTVVAAAVAVQDANSSKIGAGIQITWTEPALDPDLVDGYSATATSSAGAVYACGTIRQVAPSQFTCVVPGLVPGKAYTVAVQSRNSVGFSTPMMAPALINAGTPGPAVAVSSGSYRITSANPTCPAMGNAPAGSGFVVPTYTIANGTAGTSVALTWPSISNATCDPFTGSRLSTGAGTYGPGSTAPTGGVTFWVLTAIDAATGKAVVTVPVKQGDSTKVTALGASQTSTGVPSYRAILTGLTAGKSYLFAVAGNNSPTSTTTGTAAYSSAWTGTATYAVPDQKQNVSAASLGTVPVMDAEPAHLGSTWDYVAGGVQPSPFASQVDLYASGLYASLADPSSTVDPSYISATPTPVKAISADVRAGAIQVYWRAPDNFSAGIGWGLQTVKSYLATARYVDPAGKVTVKTCAVTGVGGTNCAITGLTNGVGYQVYVQAMGGALGPAAYVSAAGVDTDVPATPSYVGGDPAVTPALVVPIGLPGAPSAVKAVVPAVSPNSAAAQPWGTATVSWLAPADNGGRPVTAYRITATPTDPTIGSTLIGNELTAYLCKNPADPDLSTAASFVKPLAARTQGADALDISDTTGASLASSCDTRASAKWGLTYTFPKGSLSSQTGWTFKVAAYTGYHDTTLADPVWWGGDSAGSAKVVPNGAPMAPTKVTTTAKPSAITATWTAPTVLGGWPLAGYQANLYHYVGGVPTPAGFCRTAVAITSCSVAVGSDPGANADGGSYFFMVQAYNQGYPGGVPASNESAVSNTVPWYDTPDPVLNVDNAVPADKSIFVSWTGGGAQGPGKDPITSYTASATAGGAAKTCVVDPPATACTISGLTDGTPYLVSVTESNPGATSKPVYFTGIPSTGKAVTVTPGAVPAAPASVGVSPRDGGVDVWWTAPKSNGGAVVQQYIATVYPGGASCMVEMPGPLACKVEPLANGVNYVASVVAVNSFGTSPASASSQVFVPFGLPHEPLNVQAFPQNRMATVTWEAPTDDGGKPLTSYQATAMPLVSGAGTLRSCTAGNPNPAPTTTKTTTPAPVVQVPLTCDITGLTNGVDYVVYVTATNAAGRSGRSAMTAPFRSIGAPDAPTGVVAYTDLGGPTAGTTTLHVGWNPSINDGGSPLVSYTATASNGKSCTAYGGQTWCDIHELTAGIKYTVSVTAVNTDGYVSPASAKSAPSAPAGPPTAPSSVVATGVEGGAVIKWAPGKSHGAPITLYVVTLQPTGDVIRVPGNKTSIIVHDLDPALTYRALVQAESGPTLVSGMSRISNAVRPFLMPARMTKPKAKAVKTTHGYKVIVGWTAPASPGNPITGYVVKLAGGPQKQVAGSKRRAVFKGLAARHRYAFSVIPIGRFGQANASPAVVVRTRG